MGRVSRQAVAAVAVVAAFMAVGVSPAFATAVVCGQVITQTTKVSNDLTNCPGDGLVIGAAHIKLDLGKHVIDGDGVNAATDDGIDNTGGFDNVSIKGGKIQQFSVGVHLTNASKNKVEHVEVLQNAPRGILLQGSNDNEIEHNSAHNDFDGIFLVNSDRNKIAHNEAFANGSSGIVLQFGNDDNVVEHNQSFGHPYAGITEDGSTGTKISYNDVHDNTGNGILPFNSTGLTIGHNSVKHNAMVGIYLFNVDGSLVDDNKIDSNNSNRILTQIGSTGNGILKNHSDRNGADGIHVIDPGNTLAKNHADKNGSLGIFAAAGNVDGGGNKAKHNGNPLECIGVSCH